MTGMYLTERAKLDELMQCDIFVVQRMANTSFLNSLRNYIKASGSKAKIVMDFDDNPFDVSPLSPHYHDHGTSEICFQLPDGTTQWAWKNGVNNFDVKRNKQMLDEIRENLKTVDMVTTTTEVLADQFRPLNSNVRVLPNCVDLTRWNSVQMVRPNDEIRMYWGGGISHGEDLLLLRDPLKKVFTKYPKLKLVIMGWISPGLKEFLGPDRIEFHKWVPVEAYPYRMQTLDIDFGVIPLRDTKFNVCKSPIKWIELASLGVPSVTSFISPYKEMNGLSEQSNGVYIEENDSEAWVKGISFMIENLEERKKMGREARRTVEGNFDINTQYHQWVNAYQEAMCLSPALQH